MGNLKGKNVFITGTSQGIGAAISRSLIEAGAHVCLHYFSSIEEPQKLQHLAESKGQKAICLQADLRKEAEVINCIKQAQEYLGVFDALINNTGSIVERKVVSEVTTDYWNTLIDINLTTMMLVTRELIPYLNTNSGASIVNIASLAGRTGGHPGSLVYSMCKGAVLTWTRSLAKELAPQGIRVNAVAPGFIEGTNFHNTHTTKESALQTIKQIPLGRSGHPDDVARVVSFLASEYDGFTTGATIDINGGIYSA
jgi:3-oxoacyl-[acyl-carrier protein] reductase